MKSWIGLPLWDSFQPILQRIPWDSSWFLVGSCLFLALVYLAPQWLFAPGLSLIDDGATYATCVSPNWISGLLPDTTNGRFRPFHVLTHCVAPWIFGTHVAFWFLYRAFWLVLALILIWKIIRHFTKNPLYLSVLGVILLLPTTSENYYRLGTAEPQQLVFVLLAIFLTMKKNIRWQPVFLAWLATLWTKETSLFLLPMAIVWYVFWRGINRESGKLAVSLIGVGLISRLFFSSSQGYGSSFVLDAAAPWRYMHLHWPVAWPDTYVGLITVISFALVSLFFRTTAEIRKLLAVGLMFFGFFAASLFPLFFWAYYMERYVFVPQVLLLLAGVLFLEIWLQILHSSHPSKWWGIAVVGLLVISLTSFRMVLKAPFILLHRTYDSLSAWHREYGHYGSMSQWLLDRSFEAVYVEVPDGEITYELGLYATHFSRKDTRVISEKASTRFLNECQKDCVLIVREVPESILKNQKLFVVEPIVFSSPLMQQATQRFFVITPNESVL